jgi:nucleoside-diphosphate-sugar epimerase
MKQRPQMGERVLLVGATGRVGRMLSCHWPAADSVLIAQHRNPGQAALCWPLLDGVAPLKAEVSRNGPFHAMIMLAGVTPATGPDLSLNSALALAALAGAQAAGIPRVLLASSSAVYGAGQGGPLDETAPLFPANAYGAAKVTMEAEVQRFRAELELCILRIGNVAGADAALLNVAASAPDQPVLLDRFANGQGPWRSYIGAGALARVLHHLAHYPAPLPEVLNLAAPKPIAMEALVAATGHRYAFRPAPATAHQSITLDCQRLAALYPFAPSDSDPATMVADWKKTRHHDPR